MVRTWQLWLSSRPVRRTETPSEPRMLSQNGAALFEFHYERDGKLVVRETHYAEHKLVQDGRSGPPLYVAHPSSLNMPSLAEINVDTFTVAKQSTFKLRPEPWLSSGMERRVFLRKVVASSKSLPEPGIVPLLYQHRSVGLTKVAAAIDSGPKLLSQRIWCSESGRSHRTWTEVLMRPSCVTT